MQMCSMACVSGIKLQEILERCKKKKKNESVKIFIP